MNDFGEVLRAAGERALAAWRSFLAYVSDLRTPRPREVDPTTPPPSRRPGARTTVVATAADDIASVVARIEAARSPEVVLVVPREARALRSPAAWPHIAAVAKRNSLALGVVSPRGDVRSHARENGLPAAGSVTAVTRPPHHRIQLGDREFYVPRLPLGAVVRAVALVAMIGAAVIVGCYAIPSAEVVIVPASEAMTATARVRLNAIAGEPDLELGVQPAISFQHEFRTTLGVVTTGEAEVPDERATVVLQFSNGNESDAVVPAGTVVAEENGIAFATDVETAVPAGSAATAPATAVAPGTSGNVALATLTTSFDLPSGITVTNPAAASGGTNQLVPAVAEEDVARVADLADAVLRRIGERELFDAVIEGTVFPQTISVSIFSQDSLANPGEPAETFLVDFTAIVSALVVTDAQAIEYGEALIASELEADRVLLPGSTSAELDGARVEGGTVTVELTATGLVADRIDTAVARDAIAGASPADASVRLQEMLALEAPPQISISPGFIPWRWLPRSGDRISISFAGPASLLEESEEESDEEDALALDAESTATAPASASATGTAEP